MAVSIAQLAAALRVDNPEEADVLDNLTHWLQAAREIVAKTTADCPVAVADGAIIRLASYWYDQPTAARGQSYANALVNSGAGALLGPWIVRRLANPVDLPDNGAGGLPTPPATPTARYGIASGWLDSGPNDPLKNPTNDAFTQSAIGLQVPVPISAANGRLLLWLEDRTPGNPVTIAHASLANTQLVFHADSPYAYSLLAMNGHIWISSAVLVPLSPLYPGGIITVELVE